MAPEEEIHKLEELQDSLEQELEGSFERSSEVPDIEAVALSEDGFIQDGYGPGVLEDGSIRFNRDILDEYDSSDLARLWAAKLEERALEDVFNRKVGSLADDMGVETGESFDAFFQPMDEVAAAGVNGGRRELYVNTDSRGGVSLNDHVMATDFGLDNVLDHEAGHGLQAEKDDFSHLTSIVGMKTEGFDEYTYHPDRVGVEALTVFEEDPLASGDHALTSEKLADPWRLPVLLSDEYRPDDEDDDRSYINGGSGFELGQNLYSGPYPMAEIVAYAVRDHLKRQEHVDDPAHQTRKALYDIVGNAGQWEEMLEGIWEEKGVPNYHELFRENYSRIQNDPVYAKDELRRLESEMYDIEEGEDDIELFYRARSFLHAYRESGREEPESLKRLKRVADSYPRKRRYIPDR